MRILKFGGSSLETPERVRRVCDIVRDAARASSIGVVVSAFGGVTDELERLAARAAETPGADPEGLAALEARHREALAELGSDAEREAVAEALETQLEELRGLLHGIGLVGELSAQTLDRTLAQGELLSSLLVAAALRAAGAQAQACDARQLIVAATRDGATIVNEADSFTRIRAHFASPGGRDGLQVVTGFIAADASGRTTTLGRGGSDFTAALVGAALSADAVELWTDVDGVMSADPRIVRDAITLPQLSYEELAELSHFGAKVVQPSSVHPTRLAGIPLWIRNTFQPDAPGTEIRSGAADDDRPVRGVASIRNVALLRLEGDGMVGVPGIAMRLFGALARRNVSVILISQASSEHSICFAVAPQHLADARDAVDQEFEMEIQVGRIDPLVVEQGMSVVAVVGAGMRSRAGLSGRLFSTLGAHAINVHAIAQGSSELNISVVVADADESRAVNAVHDAFFLAGTRTVEVFLAGVGGVGSALLGQLALRRRDLHVLEGLRLRLRGVASSTRVLSDAEGIEPGEAVARLKSEGEGGGMAGALEEFAHARAAQRVFVDCTANPDVPKHYDALLRAGVAVVTANKLRLAGDRAAYEVLQNAGPGRLYYETTVGAGLPVVRTLTELLATGDRLLRIEGVFSGTISFIMAKLRAGLSFSAAVREAFDAGFTEPDPRDDLGGLDVARKLVILSRIAGFDVALNDVKLSPLLNADARTPLDAFWKALPEHDAGFSERLEAAAAKNKRLCYMASAEGGALSVALETIPETHPCANLIPGENVIVFQTERYKGNPLVVRGPGAGREVTAAGVFGDLLRAVAEGGGMG